MALFAALAPQAPISPPNTAKAKEQAALATNTMVQASKAPFPVPVFPPNPEWQTDAETQGETLLWVSQSATHPIAEPKEAPAKEGAKITGQSAYRWSVPVDKTTLDGLTLQKIRRPIVSPSGWQYTGDWQGWWLKDVLTLALQLPESALKHQYLLQRNRLGHHQTLRLTPDILDHALIATQLNGEPLPVAWGGPLWLLVFGRYHTIGLEQLLALEVSTAPSRLPSRTELYGLDDAGVVVDGKVLECSNGQWVSVKAQP